MKYFCAYLTIQDGNMSVKWGPEEEVERNRTQFLTKHGRNRSDAVILDLLHDDRVEVVGVESKGTYVRAEALITKEPGLVLMLLTADCCPISFYDPVHSAIALGHMSWQTTTLRLSEKVIAAMEKSFGTNPSELRVTIGPSARKESYVQTEVKQRALAEWAPYLTEVPGGTAIDVVGFNIAQLTERGVLLNNISVDPNDTIPSQTHFSHYRSVRTSEPEGRFATILVLS